MPFISERDRAKIAEWFDKELGEDVRLVHFTHQDRLRPSVLIVPRGERHYYKETRDLLMEIADLSSKITLEIYDLDADATLAQEHQVDKVPATVLLGAQSYGVRFFGVPSGQSFSAFIQTIIDVSRGTGRFSPETLSKLQGIDKEVQLQVFITPI